MKPRSDGGSLIGVGPGLCELLRTPIPRTRVNKSYALGLSVHLLLGAANLVFWPSFLRLDVLMIGVVTTALHLIFIGAQAACLWAHRTTTLTEPQ